MNFLQKILRYLFYINIFPGNIVCVFVFNQKSVDLIPSFSNILKCLSIFDICFLVNILVSKGLNTKEAVSRIRNHSSIALRNCHVYNNSLTTSPPVYNLFGEVL